MSKYIILFILSTLILSCKQDKDTGNLKKIQYFKIDTVLPNVGNTKNITLEARENKISLDTLIPIEISEIQSKNVYEKYGLDFTGNCYACDLAEFVIEDGKIVISNVCDPNEYSKYDILELINEEKKIEIKTERYSFIFLRIEDEPVFKLKLSNYDINNSALRMSDFYTFKKNLIKFEADPCGDFDG
jgi:hypothetical protein